MGTGGSVHGGKTAAARS